MDEYSNGCLPLTCTFLDGVDINGLKGQETIVVSGAEKSLNREAFRW